MPVSITLRNAELSEQNHELVSRKVRNLKRFFEKVDKIDVIFTGEKHRRACEILVSAGPIKAQASAENGTELAAFDKALKSIERQLKDNKMRIIHRRQKTVNPEKLTNRSGKARMIPSPLRGSPAA